MKRASRAEEKELEWVSEVEKSINGPNNLNAEALLQYAKDNFNHIKESAEYVERKADDVIKYLALGTGLLGILIKFEPSCRSAGTSWTLLGGGFVFWVIAFLIALVARYQASYTYPENLRYLFEKMQKKGDDQNTVRTEMALSYERARISHYYRGKRKAVFLKISYFSLLIAVVFILVSILVAISVPAAH